MKRVRILKKLLKGVSPLFLVNLFQNSRSPIKFKYGYSNWESAALASVGYADDAIINKVNDETLRMLANNKGWVRDGVYFDEVQYSFEVLASLSLLCRSKPNLKVLDYGGALGSSYFQNNDIFKKFDVGLDWTIVEQEQYVRFAEKTLDHFEDLTFYSDLDEALEKSYDVVIFSSVLCYLKDPYEVLYRVATCGNPPKSIVIDRTPMNHSKLDIFAVQQVSGSIHKALLPIRDLSIHRILKVLGNDFEVTYDWECRMQPDSRSRSRGMFLLRG